MNVMSGVFCVRLVSWYGLFQFAGVVPNIPVELDITNRSDVLQQVDRAKVSGQRSVISPATCFVVKCFMNLRSDILTYIFKTSKPFLPKIPLQKSSFVLRNFS